MLELLSESLIFADFTEDADFKRFFVEGWLLGKISKVRNLAYRGAESRVLS